MLETGHLQPILQAALQAAGSCQSMTRHIELDGGSTVPFIVRHL